jgi:mannitol/fructose-specific phosphotransferase system IIA component (Ntr-type)
LKAKILFYVSAAIRWANMPDQEKCLLFFITARANSRNNALSVLSKLTEKFIVAP